MNVEQEIEQRIRAELELIEFRLENESHMHSGPRSDTHFKLVAVSPAFAGKRPVQRHQLVYRLVGELMQNPIHALALHLYTPDEWASLQTVPASPNCMGGSSQNQG